MTWKLSVPRARLRPESAFGRSLSASEGSVCTALHHKQLIQTRTGSSFKALADTLTFRWPKLHLH
ncbi:hypothetical protein M3J09_010791 [Ascochyta lentis]